MSALGGKLAAFLASAMGKMLLVLALVMAILFGVRQCQKARQAGREASLSAELSKAVSESGKDAVGVVGAVSGRNTATDEITRENADAIRNAQGAGAPVDPAVRDAVLGGLCKRAAYRSDPKCLQRSASAGMANAGAGSAAPRE